MTQPNASVPSTDRVTDEAAAERAAERVARAEIILAQLGGGMMRLMTGARDFVATAAGLRFTLPEYDDPAVPNRVEVELTPADFYTMRVWRHDPDALEDLVEGGIDFEAYEARLAAVRAGTLREAHDLYDDALAPAFTRLTGLDTRL